MAKVTINAGMRKLVVAAVVAVVGGLIYLKNPQAGQAILAMAMQGAM